MNEPIFSNLNGKASGFIVSGAGETGVNGTYCEAGTYENRPYYTYLSPTLGTLYLVYQSAFETWMIGYDLDNGTECYYTSGLQSGNTPPLNGWESSFWGIEIGGSPAPTLSSTTC
jgi:hypothetical protein